MIEQSFNRVEINISFQPCQYFLQKNKFIANAQIQQIRKYSLTFIATYRKIVLSNKHRGKIMSKRQTRKDQRKRIVISVVAIVVILAMLAPLIVAILSLFF